jgi:16S rRNA (cytidine1402-2'-O)-methyltransferase
MENKGNLYLIPTTLGETSPLEVLPIAVKKIIEEVDYYIVENEKTARRFIKSICATKQQSILNINVLNKYTTEEEVNHFLDPCDEGHNIGIISEAGCPGIADPGAEIVKLAHEKYIKAIPLVGPSSIFLSLMASGLNGQNFTFNGYLPIDSKDRKSKLKLLEKLSFEHNQTQIFIETPYRNNKILEDVCKSLNDNTRFCVACDITLPSEYIKTLTIKEWKKEKVDLHKKPTIFLFLKD